MIGSLFSFLDDLFAEPAETPDDRQHRLELAAAALMLEVARADNTVDDDEIRHVRELLDAAYDINTDEMEALISLATERVEAATDLYQFTQRINDEMNYEEKTSLVRDLWKVARADGDIDAHENHIIRRVAGLLHVAHGDFIKAKIDSR